MEALKETWFEKTEDGNELNLERFGSPVLWLNSMGSTKCVHWYGNELAINVIWKEKIVIRKNLVKLGADTTR